MDRMFDAIIVGNGPAGLSAALYLLRAGFSVAVVGMDDGALGKAEKIENYFGLEHPLSGSELAAVGKRQVKQLGGELIRDEVVGIAWNDDFTVALSKSELTAKAVILTTGSARKTAKIENLAELEGKGVSYCAVCDAFFYKARPVAVLGSGEYALHEAMELVDIASGVTVLTNGIEPTAVFPDGVEVIVTPVSRLEGKNGLEKIILQDGRIIKAEGLFVALGSADTGALARKLGLPLEQNKIVVERDMSTALPGVFAAGDCIGGIQQIATAVGEGATAGLSAIRFLREKKRLSADQ